MQGVTGGGVGHGKQPPTLFRREAKPVLDSGGNKRRVGVLHSPGQQRQFLAQQPSERIVAAFPATGRQTVLFQPTVELNPYCVGNGIPLHPHQCHPQLGILDANTQGGWGVALLRREDVLGDQHLPATLARYRDHEMMFGFLRLESKSQGIHGVTSSRLKSALMSSM